MNKWMQWQVENLASFQIVLLLFTQFIYIPSKQVFLKQQPEFSCSQIPKLHSLHYIEQKRDMKTVPISTGNCFRWGGEGEELAAFPGLRPI